MNKFSDFNIEPNLPLAGNKISVTSLYNKEVIITNFKFTDVAFEGKLQETVIVQFKHYEEDQYHVFFTRSQIVKDQLRRVDKSKLPFKATVIHENNCLHLA